MPPPETSSSSRPLPVVNASVWRMMLMAVERLETVMLLAGFHMEKFCPSSEKLSDTPGACSKER